MGLPRSIIKKYGVTKKAWQVYRGGSNTKRAHKSSNRQKTTTKVSYVAKRRKSRKGGFFKKHYSSRSGVSPEGLIVPALVYGAARQKLSGMLSPITSKVPLGDVADEVVLGTAAYFIAKKVNNKMVKDVARAALTIEAARLGEAAISGSIFGNGTTSSGSQVI